MYLKDNEVLVILGRFLFIFKSLEITESCTQVNILYIQQEGKIRSYKVTRF